MAQLDKTFPTNDCSACIFSPKLQTLAQNPNIEILAYSRIEGIEGEAGNFRVKVRRKARYVDPDKCTSCGTCAEKCPTKIPNEYNFGHDMRKAIYKDYAQGIPSVYTIDTENCRVFLGKKCGVCKKICPAGAVDYEQKDVIEDIEVGAVILSPGTNYSTQPACRNSDMAGCPMWLPTWKWSAFSAHRAHFEGR